jgi:hypothetical protein
MDTLKASGSINGGVKGIVAHGEISGGTEGVVASVVAPQTLRTISSNIHGDTTGIKNHLYG